MNGPGARWAVRWTLLLALTALWLAVGAHFVGGIWIVSGPSMRPTLEPGDWVVVDRWTLRQRPPRRGEIVLLWLPGHEGAPAVKRVGGVAPDGRVLEVFGDNPAVSLDSREFGAVPRGYLLGRVVGRSGVR